MFPKYISHEWRSLTSLKKKENKYEEDASLSACTQLCKCLGIGCTKCTGRKYVHTSFSLNWSESTSVKKINKQRKCGTYRLNLATTHTYDFAILPCSFQRYNYNKGLQYFRYPLDTLYRHCTVMSWQGIPTYSVFIIICNVPFAI